MGLSVRLFYTSYNNKISSKSIFSFLSILNSNYFSDENAKVIV